MPLYTLADAMESLSGSDNEMHDGLDPVAKINIKEVGGDRLQVTLTPYDDEGSTDDRRAEVFVFEGRRIEEPTS